MTTVKNIVRRITLFYLLTVVLSLLIVAQIIYLQFFTDLKNKAQKIRTEQIKASRGNIYSHDMRLLAVSISNYDIRIDFYALKENFVNNQETKMNLYYQKLRQDFKTEIKALGLTKKEIKNRTEALENRIKEKRSADTINANAYINNEIKSLADSLSHLFKDKNASEYENFIKTCCRKSAKTQDTMRRGSQENYRYTKIGRRNIDYIELNRLLEFPVFKHGKGMSGLITEEETFRIPVYGSLAMAVVGRVNSNGFASSGIEKSFDEYLKGKDGLQAMIAGKAINDEMNVLPEVGCDVVTTLDVNIQETAEKALIQQIKQGNDNGIAIEGGTAIVMETATGEIRAVANMKRNSNGTYDETYNYALMESKEPGSTFKLASLIALLDDEFVDLNDVIDVKADAKVNNGRMTWKYKKYEVNDDHVFGKLSVKQIFANSSNIGMAKLVTKYYDKNPQTFFDKLHAIGLFQQPFNLQIKGAPSFAFEPKNNEKIAFDVLRRSAYGYDVMLAPIHTVTFYNAVANNGKMMKPKFVKEIIQHGQVIKSYSDEVINDKICSKEALTKARIALQGVVDSGTVKRFRDRLPFDFAGKTGTSRRVRYRTKERVTYEMKEGVKYEIKDSISESFYQDREGIAYQASFVGYIPSDKPKYSIIVVMYSPPIKGNFYGSTYAAPVFLEIAAKLYSTDVNWFDPVELNKDSLYLPNMKNTVAQRIKTITSKLDIPIDSDAKNSDWVNISKSNSKLTATKIQIDDNKVPSVINMGLRDAVYLLEKSGMKVRFSGKGKIKRQSVLAGTTVVKGATIDLELEI
ncbi:MAG: PASTA domain-containing protein [Prevotellaceae bacterium]|jgi:cell division protein FtsI (penicillin-binding protein 3)|nr:PASTA domain-containing protein [Prevotellaceae bacterium]